VLNLCSLKLFKELADVLNIYGLLSLSLHQLFFNHCVLWMGLKPARSSPMFTNCRWWTIKIIASCENLIGGLCNCLVTKRYSNAMKTIYVNYQDHQDQSGRLTHLSIYQYNTRSWSVSSFQFVGGWVLREFWPLRQQGMRFFGTLNDLDKIVKTHLGWHVYIQELLANVSLSQNNQIWQYLTNNNNNRHVDGWLGCNKKVVPLSWRGLTI
jgi:hypothetical protein